MDDISYVAAVGGSAVAGVVIWWGYGHHYSALKRGLVSFVACILAFVFYFLLGVLFIVTRPDIAHATGVAIGHGTKLLTTMLILVNAIVLTARGRAKA
jgi:hypothetical protein